MSNWYCPKCECYVAGEQVTFAETHQTCGTPVEDGEQWQQMDAMRERIADLEKENMRLLMVNEENSMTLDESVAVKIHNAALEEAVVKLREAYDAVLDKRQRQIKEGYSGELLLACAQGIAGAVNVVRALKIGG